jgi:Ca2+-binding EF-hand superfamily protein
MKLLPILFISGISAVFAQEQPPVAPQSAPAPAMASKRFQKLDKDGDGRISLDEFKAMGKDPAKREKRFRKLDANHDGYLTPDEFAAGMPRQRS